MLTLLQEVITAVRTVRAELGVPPSRRLRLQIEHADPAERVVLDGPRRLSAAVGGSGDVRVRRVGAVRPRYGASHRPPHAAVSAAGRRHRPGGGDRPGCAGRSTRSRSNSDPWKASSGIRSSGSAPIRRWWPRPRPGTRRRGSAGGSSTKYWRSCLPDGCGARPPGAPGRRGPPQVGGPPREPLIHRFLPGAPARERPSRLGPFAGRVHHHPRVRSTNDVAALLAGGGAPHGTVGGGGRADRGGGDVTGTTGSLPPAPAYTSRCCCASPRPRC